MILQVRSQFGLSLGTELRLSFILFSCGLPFQNLIVFYLTQILDVLIFPFHKFRYWLFVNLQFYERWLLWFLFWQSVPWFHCCFSVWSLVLSAFVSGWFEKLVYGLLGCLLFGDWNLRILFFVLLTLFYWEKTVCVFHVVHWLLLWFELSLEKPPRRLIKVYARMKHDIVFLVLYDRIRVRHWHGLYNFMFLNFLFALPYDKINHMLGFLKWCSHWGLN